MIKLYDNDEGSLMGMINQTQLNFLIDHLEETDSDDQDYYIDAGTLGLLEDEGADAELLTLLRGALGDRDGFEVRWAAAE